MFSFAHSFGTSSTTALAGGSLVFLAAVIVLIFAIAWSLYSRSGSDITPRPSDGLGRGGESAAPGAAGDERTAGKVDGEQDSFDTHGTR